MKRWRQVRQKSSVRNKYPNSVMKLVMRLQIVHVAPSGEARDISYTFLCGGGRGLVVPAGCMSRTAAFHGIGERIVASNVRSPDFLSLDEAFTTMTQQNRR